MDSRTAMKYTAVFACVRVLAEALAGTPMMLYRKKENGDRETRNDLAILRHSSSWCTCGYRV
jgi:phage portal protein BeeE